jgi:hypothetical protein
VLLPVAVWSMYSLLYHCGWLRACTCCPVQCIAPTHPLCSVCMTPTHPASHPLYGLTPQLEAAGLLPTGDDDPLTLAQRLAALALSAGDADGAAAAVAPWRTAGTAEAALKELERLARARPDLRITGEPLTPQQQRRVPLTPSLHLFRCVYVCACAHVCVCAYTYACVYVCVCVCAIVRRLSATCLPVSHMRRNTVRGIALPVHEHVCRTNLCRQGGCSVGAVTQTGITCWSAAVTRGCTGCPSGWRRQPRT